MNETGPVQKQDIDRVVAELKAMKLLLAEIVKLLHHEAGGKELPW